MRLGIPLWRDEVSPVFDVAEELVVIDVEDAREVARRVISLGPPHAVGRAFRLAAMDVDVLVCGVITRPLEKQVTAAGVRIVSRACGPVERVARAIMSGARLPSECLMPGHAQPRVGAEVARCRNCA